VPIAIRHVEMHTHSGGVYTSYEGEYEITTGARLKLDKRAFIADDHSMPGDVKKYLQKMAKSGGEPASGAILYEANKALNNPSFELPLPPEKPEIQPMPVAGAGTAKLYKEVPAAIAQKAGAMVFDLPYAGGSQEDATGPLEHLGVKAGDFIEGMKGTRYLIIDDPGDPTSSLRYVKIEPGTKLPNYAKSFPFNASAGNSFRRLDGHIDIPEPEKKKAVGGFVPFGPKQYAALMEGPQSKLATWQPGDMFKVDGEGYKVVGPHGGKVQVESLDTGKKFLANGAYKPKKLVPTGSFKPPKEGDAPAPSETPGIDAVLGPVKTWKPGDRVLVSIGVGGHKTIGSILHENGATYMVATPNMPEGMAIKAEDIAEPPPMPGLDQGKNYAALSLTLEKGDKFAWKGKNYTVTNVTKGGTVKAKPLGGGPVEGFPASTLYGNTTFYRPSTWAIGNKAKISDLDIGDVVQGGAGAKIRPYMLEGLLGSKAYLRNLETGELVKVTKNKQYARLLDAEDIAKAAGPGPGEKPKAAVKLVPGPVMPLAEMEVGDAHDAANVPGLHYVVLAKHNDGSMALQGIKDGTPHGPSMVLPKGVVDSPAYQAMQTLIAPSEAQVAAKPELKGDFDQSKYVEGDKAKLKDLEPGSLFISATGLAMQLKSNTPAKGATAVALHNGKTVKNVSYDKEFTTLVEKDEAPFDHANLAPGDLAQTESLEPGDVYDFPDTPGQKYLVSVPPHGDQMGSGWMLNPDGNKGVPTKFGPNMTVTFHGKFVAPSKPADLHADALPLAPEYMTYLHPKSGSKKYPLIKDMPAGTVFTDKSGEVWMVKQSGGQAVISDGEKLYSIDGGWRGKVVDDPAAHQVAYLDSPSLPSGDTAGKVTVGDLKAGDKFTIPAGYKGAGEEYVVWSDTQINSGFGTVIQAKKAHADEGTQALAPLEDISVSLAPSKITPQGMPPGKVTTGGQEFTSELIPNQLGAVVGDMLIGTKYQTANGDVWEVIPHTDPAAAKFSAKTLANKSEIVVKNVENGVAKLAPADTKPVAITQPTGGGGAPLVPTSDWTVMSEEKVKAKDMPDYSFGITDKGELVYKNPKGQLWKLGSNEQHVGDVYPVDWFGPEPEGDFEPALLADGTPETKPLSQLEPGEFFELNGKQFLVLANGEEGLTGQIVAAHKYVGYAKHSTAGNVQVLAPKDPDAWVEDDPEAHAGGLPDTTLINNLVNGSKAWTLGGTEGTVTALASSDSGKGLLGKDGVLIPVKGEVYISDPFADELDKVAAVKAEGLPKVSAHYTMLGKLPLGAQVKTPDGTLEVDGFKDGEMTFKDVATGETLTFGQAKSPPSTWYLANVGTNPVRAPAAPTHIEPGTSVTFFDGQDEQEGTVVGWDDGYFKVEDYDGDVHEIDPSDISVGAKFEPPMDSWAVYKVPLGTGLGKVVGINADGDYVVAATHGPGMKPTTEIVKPADMLEPHTTGIEHLEKEIGGTVAAPKFFDGLANGDRATYLGPHAKTPIQVEVVDNQIGGPGILVKSLGSGATFQAFKPHLTPPDASAPALPAIGDSITDAAQMNALPVGSAVALGSVGVVFTKKPSGKWQANNGPEHPPTSFVGTGYTVHKIGPQASGSAPASGPHAGPDWQAVPGEWGPKLNTITLAHAVKPNTKKLKLKDLPAGSFYAFEDDIEPGTYDLMKIKQTKPKILTDIGEAGATGAPDPNYVPEYVWAAGGADARLKKGDPVKPEQVQVGDVLSSGAQSEYTVIGKNADGTVKLKDSKGKYLPGNTGYEANPLPKGWTFVSHGASSEPQKQDATFQQIKEGGVFETANGTQFKKVGHGSQSGWADKVGVPSSDKGAKQNFLLKAPVKAAPEHIADGGNPLDPYLHPKSGKYKYVHLHTLDPGTEFTDKKGGKYKVLGHVGSFTQFWKAAEPGDGTDSWEATTYTAPSNFRVKVTKPAGGNVEEGLILAEAWSDAARLASLEARRRGRLHRPRQGHYVIAEHPSIGTVEGDVAGVRAQVGEDKVIVRNLDGKTLVPRSATFHHAEPYRGGRQDRVRHLGNGRLVAA
jgi:hypothetical protein